ncbi:MAG: hypothetical protein ACJAXD_002546 [Cryomorphaceae bacterium]|jgi:hypothetical protein
MKKAFQAIKESCGLLKNNPFLALPFVLFALLEGIALYLLFLAPQEPFSKVLAPPIARIWGEQFVHYPWHLLKLPQLFYYAKLYALSLLPGMFLSAIVVGLVGDIKTEQVPKFRRHIKTSFHRFIALTIIWGLGIGVIKLFEFLYIQAIGWGESKTYLTSLQFLIYFLSFWVQILFLYAIPLVILTKQSLFKALINNFRYLGRLFLPTSLCVFLAALLYLGLYIFEKDLIGLASRTSPEIIVVVLAISIPLTFVINLLVTITSTVLFVNEQSNDPRVSLIISKASS